MKRRREILFAFTFKDVIILISLGSEFILNNDKNIIKIYFQTKYEWELVKQKFQKRKFIK